jgi:hypothetical protein
VIPKETGAFNRRINGAYGFIVNVLRMNVAGICELIKLLPAEERPN